MSQFMVVDTPAGKLLAEVEGHNDSIMNPEGIQLVSVRGKLPSFEEVCESLKKNAKYIKTSIEDLHPNEVQISFGIKLGAEGGNSFWGLAKVSGESSYTVTLKWKAE